MTKYEISKILFLAIATSLATATGCVKANEETKEIEPPSAKDKKPLSDVDKVFQLAKAFAGGAVRAVDVKVAFEKLSAADLAKLYGKQEGTAAFVVLMVIGLASDDSAVVVEKAINSGSSVTKDQMFGNELIKELLNKNRPKAEDPVKRFKLIEIVLNRYPSVINALKKFDGSFDVDLLNNLISSLDGAKLTPIIEKIDTANLDAFVTWALTNPPQGKPAFKALYDKVASKQRIMRQLLLAKNAYAPVVAMQHPKIMDFIDDAVDWGMGGAALFTDVFDLPSNVPGTLYSGNLLHVLLRYAIAKEQLPGAIPRVALLEYRAYADKIKALMGDPAYRNHVAPPPAFGVVTTQDMMRTFLAATNYEDWTNFYLAMEDVKDVFDAASKATVSNAMLHELYQLIISTNARATNLSLLPMLPGDRFIHVVVRRAIDAKIVAMVTDYLTKVSAGVAANEVPILTDNAGGSNPLQIVVATAGRPITDDGTQKKRLIERLMLNDTGAAIAALSNAELINLVGESYAERGAGGKGYADFKAIYNRLENLRATATIAKNAFHKAGNVAAEAFETAKVNKANAHKKLMRSELLRLAHKGGAGEVQSLIMDIMSPLDVWGLKLGVQTDVYNLNAINGTLAFVLTQDAINTIGTNVKAFKDLRGYTRVLKASLGSATYIGHVNGALPENGGQVIRTILEAALAPRFQQDFTDYYLAYESPRNVYDAASRPEGQVSNQILRELYDVVIGDVHQLAFDLSLIPGLGAADRFFNFLLARSTDLGGESRYLVNKFLGSLSTLVGGGLLGAQEELLQLQTPNLAGDLPFKILTVRPGIIADDPGKKLKILERMLVHADHTTMAGVTSVQLAAIVPLLMKDPATFKKIYGFFGVHTPEARALRSALLAEFYKKGPAQTMKFLQEAVHVSDPFGLRASVADATQIYDLDQNPIMIPAHSGPLLYVLVMRAIDESAGNVKAYRELRGYAEIIKNHFGGLGANYDTYATVTQFGSVPQATMKARLEAALAPSGRRLFANSFLARESFLDVYDAADEPQVLVTNAMLKSLYLSVIGHDVASVANLANHNGMLAMSDKFIHRLVKRVVDEDSYMILKFFLDDLGAINELPQLNDTGGSTYPIKLLALDTRAPGDDPVFKVKMFERLLANDNGIALGDISPGDFLSLRCFVKAGVEGQQLFTRLYGSPAVALALNGAAKLKALRSSVLNEAYDLAREKEVINQFTDVADNWGLRSGLAVDEYFLEQDPPVPLIPHQGTLLFVAVQRAIQTANRIAKYDPYKELRAIATSLRTVITLPGAYVAYATMGGFDAVANLKAELDPKPSHAGYAEYFLALDNTYAGLDADLVMSAATNVARPGVFENAQLKWLYTTAIDTDAKAINLATKDIGGNRFIHALVTKTASSASNDILADYLTRIGTTGLGPVATVIELVNGAGKNALQLIADVARKDTGAERNKAVKMLAVKSNNATMQTLRNAEVNFVLAAVGEVGLLLDLNYVFSRLDDAQMPALAAWSADRKSVIVRGSGGGAQLKDNLENDNVRDAFRNEYLTRSGNEKSVLRNGLVKRTYDIGESDSPRKGALDRIARMVERDFFSDVVLKEFTFDPFGVRNNGSLLFSVLDQAKPTKNEEVVKVVAAFRAKFVTLVEWQTYLDDVRNPGGESLITRMATIIDAGRGRMPNVNIAEAKLWLSYDI